MVASPRQTDDDRIAAVQAALRRVATLVARAAPPEDVFAAVAEEAVRLLHADFATMSRYDPEGSITVVSAWGRAAAGFPVGSRWSYGGQNLHTAVFQTGRPARIDDQPAASGSVAAAARSLGLRAAVGVPVSVEGRVWGVLIVGSVTQPPPPSTEARLAGFAELVATAISNAQARVELRGFADEQAALRRVATLVAQAAPPGQVLSAVTGEAGRLLGADHAGMGRYDADGSMMVVANWDSAGPAFYVGTRWSPSGQSMHTMIFQTGRPARIDDHDDLPIPAAEVARELGIRGAVGVPVSVGGRMWGVMVVASRTGPMPAGTETRLAGFTELAGTAIANAEAQAALTESRARIVATADATRRRIERNLHDGAQQRLVSLALDLRVAEAAAEAGTGGVPQQLDRVAVGLDDVQQELREIARGLHPAILAEGGLRPALKALARRSAVPVDLETKVAGRLPEPVEIAAYYAVSEALTNAAKHARATAVQIEAAVSDGVLHVRVRDNGRGGADFSHGSGLLGLRDRAEALGGRLQLYSPPEKGTVLEIALPLRNVGPPGLPPDVADPAEHGGRGRASAQ